MPNRDGEPQKEGLQEKSVSDYLSTQSEEMLKGTLKYFNIEIEEFTRQMESSAKTDEDREAYRKQIEFMQGQKKEMEDELEKRKKQGEE